MPNVSSSDHVQTEVMSQLHHEFWFHNMADCQDEKLKAQIFDGLNNGVNIGCTGPMSGAVYDNWPSALEYSEDVSHTIDQDLVNGRVVGPWTSPPTSGYIASPIGAFKRAGTDKIRVIHDLSFPPGQSINDHIDPEMYTLQYITVDMVAQRCASYSQPGWLAKSDLSNAFKHIVVDPSQWENLGFTWQGKYYCHTVLPFGCRSAPYLFDVYGRGLEYMARKFGSRDLYHYLDDSVTCAPSEWECNNSIDIFNDTANRAGFTLQPHKCTRASQTLEFLGIEIDTIQQTLSITQARLNDIVNELKTWQGLVVCTKRQLLSIIGKLSFASKVVRSGRTFLRRLIDLSKTVKHLHYKIKLNKAAQADFSWWLACIDSHNGVNIFPKEWDESKAMLVFTDASDLAAGVVVNGQWSIYPFQGQGQVWLNDPIHVREMLAVCVAVSTFRNELCGRQVTFKVDNMATCYAINTGSTKCKATMNLVRSLYFMLCKFNIDCRAEYINTNDNILADALSRLEVKKFFANCPAAEKVMTFPCEPEYMNN